MFITLCAIACVPTNIRPNLQESMEPLGQVVFRVQQARMERLEMMVLMVQMEPRARRVLKEQRVTLERQE